MAHLSGARPAGILRPHRPVGAIHPLRSFADPERAVRQFRGTFCALDGDETAVTVLERLVADVGGRSGRIRSEGKDLYHAGAVFASNYVVTLFAEAKALLEKAGLSGAAAEEALAGLLQGTASNISASGVPAALTGPVDRGDTGTVRRHLEALAGSDAEVAVLYRLLGARTCRVAEAKGADLPAALKALLESGAGTGFDFRGAGN